MPFILCRWDILIGQTIQNRGKLRPSQRAVQLKRPPTAGDDSRFHQSRCGTGLFSCQKRSIGELVQYRQIRLCANHLKRLAKQDKSLSPGNGVV